MVWDATTLEMIKNGIFETFLMVFGSSLISYLIGIPLGIILVVTDTDGIRPIPALQKVLGLVINLLRAVPFIIMLIMMLPVTRAIVGTTLGAKAVIPPLVAAAAPYIARMVESSFKEVDAGVIEAAQSMGATTWRLFHCSFLDIILRWDVDVTWISREIWRNQLQLNRRDESAPGWLLQIPRGR